MKTLAFIPARGGSKTISGKNLFPLGGVPLLQWCIGALKKAVVIEDIVLSTDDPLITTLAQNLNIPVTRRPIYLSGDDSPIDEVVIEYLNERDYYDAVMLIQPTSPFINPTTINSLVDYLSEHKHFNSVQTITSIPHNYHAWNQRSFNEETGEVRWCFPDLRKTGFNKQHKPVLWKFGNLVLTRVEAIRSEGFFAQPSRGLKISPIDSLDVDTKRDFELGDLFVEKGWVEIYI